MLAKTPIQVRLSDDEREALDNYRREQRNPPSRAQAARQLIRGALSGRQGADAVERTISFVGEKEIEDASTIEQSISPSAALVPRPRGVGLL